MTLDVFKEPVNLVQDIRAGENEPVTVKRRRHILPLIIRWVEVYLFVT